MDGATILSMIQHNLGDRSDVNTEIWNAVNIMQRHMVSVAQTFGHEWKSLQTLVTTGATVASTRASALPASSCGIYSVRMIIDNDSRYLIYETPRSVDKAHPYPEDDAEGKPTHYTVWGDYFYWRCVPDDAYTYYVRNTTWPSNLSAATTTEPIARSAGILIAYATAYIFASFQDTEMSTFWFNIADGGATLLRGKQKPGGLLRVLLEQDRYHEDQIASHKEYHPTPVLVGGEPWNDPFVGLNY